MSQKPSLDLHFTVYWTYLHVLIHFFSSLHILYIFLFFSFTKVYLTNTNCMFLRCTIWWLDVCIHFEIIATIKFISTSITSHRYLFIYFWGDGWGQLRPTLLATSVYNTVLLTLVTMLHIRSPELFHPITKSLDPLTSLSPFSSPHPPPSGNHYCIL